MVSLLFFTVLGFADARLVFVSFDGFRWDYLLRYADSLPTFSKFVADGVRVHNGLRNSFVTKTFPNHRTLATGLWEESHGIVGNVFWDPVENAEFGMASKDDFFWNQAEPFWTVAEKHNITTCCVLYPGCEIPSQKPTYTLGRKYSSSYSFHSIVDNLTLSLNKKDNPAELGLMYYFEPDHTGHHFGPYSNEVKEKLIVLDGYLDYLLTQLRETDNIIITSDHGMADIPINQTINLKKYINTSLIDHFYVFATEALLYVNDTNKHEVLQQLDAVVKDHPHITVYRKEEIPEQWHYKQNVRVPSVLVVASKGWIVTSSDEVPYGSKGPSIGQHGFDNMLLDMHPVFIARGPAFKKGFVHYEVVKSVDMFALVGNLTGFPSDGRNGSLSRVLPLLMVPKNTTILDQYPLQYIVLLTILCLVIFVYITYITLVALQRHQPRYKTGGRDTLDQDGYMLHNDLDDYEEDELFADTRIDRQSKQPFLPR